MASTLNPVYVKSEILVTAFVDPVIVIGPKITATSVKVPSSSKSTATIVSLLVDAKVPNLAF